ncbi:LysR family transcriptional regulator [Agrococcus baldri]|uniref:LysR family transcriptional regulator n=1 Tax=Agrococcus baldri TaxID=153730 RepID=A0AA87RJ88_9MICO|nr:LysR family transcriptional regulator [Agrococcus baldri]
MPSLRQLQYFTAVVETGAITEAGRLLRVSAGGISLAMSQLEDLLGVQLAVRTRGRGVEITDAGWRVYELARTVASGVEGIQEVASTIRGEVSGPLRLGMFTTLSPWIFPQIAEHFSHRFPSVDLQLEEGPSAQLQTRLLEGRLDAVLLYENHLEAGVQSQHIAPVRLQVALAPDHRLAAHDAVELSALEDEQAVLLSTRPAADHVEEILRAAGVVPQVRWRSANVETIRSLVARGLGYAIIMGRPHGDRTYDGLPVVYRPIADDIPTNALVLATAPGTRASARLTALGGFCREVLSSQLRAVDGEPGGGIGHL